MKILIILISILFLDNINWIHDLNLTIKKINRESILIDQKTSKDQAEEVVIKKYKLGDYRKTELIIEGKIIDTLNSQYFSKGKLIFAKFDFMIAEYVHKGAKYPGRALGEITETRHYFESEISGVKLSRTIDYYQNSNLDSITTELGKQFFDSTVIGNSDYLKIKESFKRINKGF